MDDDEKLVRFERKSGRGLDPRRNAMADILADAVAKMSKLGATEEDIARLLRDAADQLGWDGIE